MQSLKEALPRTKPTFLQWVGNAALLIAVTGWFVSWTGIALAQQRQLGDLALEISAPTTVAPGAAVTVELVAHNLGSEAVDHVAVTFDTHSGFEIDTVSSPAGECVITSHDLSRCDVGTLAVGQSVTIAARGIAGAPNFYRLDARIEGHTYDPVGSNSAVAAPLNVAPPTQLPRASLVFSESLLAREEGGGGATDWLWLGALFASLAMLARATVGSRHYRPRRVERSGRVKT